VQKTVEKLLIKLVIKVVTSLNAKESFMHPRQASLVTNATEVMDRIAAEKKPGGALLMWKYTDPDGKIFYLDERKLTIKSPFSGKSFTSKPERFTPSQMVKEIKEEAKGGGATKEASAVDRWKI